MRIHRTTGLCCFLFCVWSWTGSQALAQFDLEGLRNRLEGEFRQAIPRVSGPSNQGGSSDQREEQPSTEGFSLPGESGQQNNPGGSFRDDGGFDPNSSRPPRASGTSSNSYYQRQQPNRATTSYPDVPTRQRQPNGQTIRLRAPRGLTSVSRYQLQTGGKQYRYEMNSGESQTFPESAIWLIRLQSGPKELVYRLRGGNSYEFDVDSQGDLKLYRIDPSAPPEPPMRR